MDDWLTKPGDLYWRLRSFWREIETGLGETRISLLGLEGDQSERSRDLVYVGTKALIDVKYRKASGVDWVVGQITGKRLTDVFMWRAGEPIMRAFYHHRTECMHQLCFCIEENVLRMKTRAKWEFISLAGRLEITNFRRLWVVVEVNRVDTWRGMIVLVSYIPWQWYSENTRKPRVNVIFHFKLMIRLIMMRLKWVRCSV